MENQKRKYGLFPLPRDKRDYSHRRTFGSLDVSQLPSEYILPSTVLNQGFTSECTAYTAAAIQETQYGIRFDPDWFFGQEGIVAGAVNPEGYDLRVQQKTGVEKGFKPVEGNDLPEKYKEDSYFAIDGYRDLFDNIRVAMYLGKDEKRCASLGLLWHSEFEQPTGIIPETFNNPVGLHDVKCAGWKQINGQPYLVIQNSYGAGAGNNGFYYFNRIIANKVFKEGAFCWRTKPDPQQIQTISTILNLISKLVTLYQILITRIKGRNQKKL